MGKIEHSSQFRRPTYQTSKQNRSRSGWNPSGTTIFNIGMAAFALFWAVSERFGPDMTATSANAGHDSESASFSFCHESGGTNCVVDGDTIWYRGTNIRIADIDTPETHSPRCDEEAELGEEATDRLQDLMNAGAFSIQNIDRDTDKYGRQLRVLTRNGESIGGMLVDEGLARWYEGGRRPWC
jgi:micrococcal nuclease